MINLPMFPVLICIDEADKLCDNCKAMMSEMLMAMQSKPFYKRYVSDV
jgi:hypothetical protein